MLPTTIEMVRYITYILSHVYMGNMVEENVCIRAFFSSTVLLSVREVFERYNFCNVSEMSALASF